MNLRYSARSVQDYYHEGILVCFVINGIDILYCRRLLVLFNLIAFNPHDVFLAPVWSYGVGNN